MTVLRTRKIGKKFSLFDVKDYYYPSLKEFKDRAIEGNLFWWIIPGNLPGTFIVGIFIIPRDLLTESHEVGYLIVKGDIKDYIEKGDKLSFFLSSSGQITVTTRSGKQHFRDLLQDLDLLPQYHNDMVKVGTYQIDKKAKGLVYYTRVSNASKGTSSVIENCYHLTYHPSMTDKDVEIMRNRILEIRIETTEPVVIEDESGDNLHLIYILLLFFVLIVIGLVTTKLYISSDLL
jgi:hypothetical protein